MTWNRINQESSPLGSIPSAIGKGGSVSKDKMSGGIESRSLEVATQRGENPEMAENPTTRAEMMPIPVNVEIHRGINDLKDEQGKGEAVNQETSIQDPGLVSRAAHSSLPGAFPIASTSVSRAFSASGSTETKAQSSSSSPGSIPPNIPVVFGNSKALAALPPSQQEQVQQIASDFNAAIQNSGVSPNDASYSKVWNKAAFDADQAYMAQYGVDAFNALQISQENKN